MSDTTVRPFQVGEHVKYVRKVVESEGESVRIGQTGEVVNVRDNTKAADEFGSVLVFVVMDDTVLGDDDHIGLFRPEELERFSPEPSTGAEVEVLVQGLSPMRQGTRGKVIEKPANSPEHDDLVRVQFDGGHDWYFLPRSLRSVPTNPPTTTAQDHGPLAAPLSDRTLAKVLSRPAYVPAGEVKPTRVFGFNLVTISPDGTPGTPRLDGVVSRQRAQDELDDLEPFMVDGWTTVMVELREVQS